MKNMKVKLLTICLFISCILISCYEDNGNYKYDDINDIEIELPFSVSVTPEDTLKVVPKLKFKHEDETDLTFQWTIDAKVVSDKKVLKVLGKDITKGNSAIGVITIKNNQTGVTYFNKVNIYLKHPFEKGWLFACEKDGQCDINFLQIKKETDDEGNESYSFNVFEDLYSKANGEKLKGSPVKFVEHWYANDWTVGDVILVQNGTDSSIDMDGFSFMKKAYMGDYFIDGKRPENFNPVDELYLPNTSYMLDSDGRLFTRKSTEAKMKQSGRYNNSPIYIEDGVNITNIIRNVGSLSFCSLFFDAKNRRYLVATEGLTKDCTVKTFNAFSYRKGFSHFDDLEMDFIAGGVCSYGDVGKIDYFMILKDDYDDYYYQQFHMDYTYYNNKMSFPSYLMKQGEFRGSYRITDKTKWCIRRGDDYVFLSSGADNDKLYMYDRATRYSPKLYFDFEGKNIVSIEYGKTMEQILVALESGEVYILRTDKDAREDDTERVYWSGKITDGKIRCASYKFGSQNSFNYIAD